MTWMIQLFDEDGVAPTMSSSEPRPAFVHHRNDTLAAVSYASSPESGRTLERLFSSRAEIDESRIGSAVRTLRGAFSGVVWTPAAAYLFRDHAGLEPLYYAKTPSGIIAGSSFDAVFQEVPERLRVVNDRVVYEYLRGGQPQSLDETGIACVRRAAPGSVVTVARNNTGEVRSSRFWHAEVRPGSAEFDPAALRETLVDSLQAQLGDRMIDCATLSSGMDSTSVLVLAQRAGLLANHAVAYTNSSSDRDIEPQLAGEVARHCGVEHLIQYRSLASQLRAATEMLDTESPVTAMPPEIVDVPDVAGGRPSVLLTGFGGDPVQKMNRETLRRWTKSEGRPRVAARYARTLLEDRRIPPTFLTEGMRTKAHDTHLRDVGHSFLAEEFCRRWSAEYDERAEQASHRRAVSTPGDWAFESSFWPALIESRTASFPEGTQLYPFLDWQLNEALGALRPLPWMIRKRALRSAMDGLLPASVLERAKTVRNPTGMLVSVQDAAVQELYEWLLTQPGEIANIHFLDWESLVQATKAQTPPNWWWPRLLRLLRFVKWYKALRLP